MNKVESSSGTVSIDSLSSKDYFSPSIDNFSPTRDYLVFKEIIRDQYSALTKSLGGILSYSEVSEVFGEAYPMVVAVGPSVESGSIKVGDRVSFSSGFLNEIKISKKGIRINSLIHRINMDGKIYFLVPAGHVVGIYR